MGLSGRGMGGGGKDGRWWEEVRGVGGVRLRWEGWEGVRGVHRLTVVSKLYYLHMSNVIEFREADRHSTHL